MCSSDCEIVFGIDAEICAIPIEHPILEAVFGKMPLHWVENKQVGTKLFLVGIVVKVEEASSVQIGMKRFELFSNMSIIDESTNDCIVVTLQGSNAFDSQSKYPLNSVVALNPVSVAMLGKTKQYLVVGEATVNSNNPAAASLLAWRNEFQGRIDSYMKFLAEG
jgi:hypothetical protein